MTSIVAFHLNSHILIAADKRAVQINGNTRTVVSDDIDKLIEWHGGVITGAGNAEMLEHFKFSLQEASVINSNQILELAKQTTIQYAHLDKFWFDTTCWYFTYVAEENGRAVPRLAQISANELEIRALEPGSIRVHAKIPNREEFQANIMPFMQTSNDLDEKSIADSISYHNALMREIFAVCAEQTEDTSEAYDLFFASPRGSCFISS